MKWAVTTFLLKTNAAIQSFCHSVGRTAAALPDGDAMCIPFINNNALMCTWVSFGVITCIHETLSLYASWDLKSSCYI